MMVTARPYDSVLRSLERERASLLMGLHRLQHEYGYISNEGMAALANHIRVPAVEVHAAALTYSELRFAPAPSGLRRICAGLACRLNGADALLTEARADGEPLEEVACFFACGVAPLAVAGEPPAMFGRVRHVGELAASRAPEGEPRATRSTLARHTILVGGGSCGRALGAGALIAALRETAGDSIDVVETGCNGACWAQPLVSVRGSDGRAQVVAVNAVNGSDAFARSAPEVVAAAATAAPNTALEAWLSGQERRLLERCGAMDPASLEEYIASGGYSAWETVRQSISSDMVHARIAEAELLGRGGAYFPASRKWETAINAPGDVYLVVNVEEGEPGVFKDRHLCEGDPHAVIEGMLIAAHAVQAPNVFIYINGQADRAAERITTAFRQAVDAGLVPEALSVKFLRGAGGYICGEESVILNSIEGFRAVPRLRPPFPAEAGLWGQPTVMKNAETIANLPLIMRHGPAWFRSMGTPAAPGTKLLCLAGALPRPGVVEVPFGTPLRRIVEGAGGAARDDTIALIMGGPSGGLVPAAALDAPLTPGTIDSGGAILGAGGVTVVDRSLSPLEIARHLTAYNAAESCGKCTPCREGTARVETILARLLAGAAEPEDGDHLHELNEAIRLASLCGLGQAAPNPVTSLLAHFPPAALRHESAGSADGRSARP